MQCSSLLCPVPSSLPGTLLRTLSRNIDLVSKLEPKDLDIFVSISLVSLLTIPAGPCRGPHAPPGFRVDRLNMVNELIVE